MNALSRNAGRWSIGAVLSFAAIASIILGIVSLSPVATPPSAAERDPQGPAVSIDADFHGLLAPDGLYYIPQLRAPLPPSAYDSAYGLGILRMLGVRAPLRMPARDVRAFALAATKDAPLWGRWYLQQIAESSRTPILTASDARGVLRFLRPEGYFRDPGAGPADTQPLPINVTATHVALDVLASTKGVAFVRRLTSTRAWLLSVVDQVSPQPFLASWVADSLHLLGVPLPERLLRGGETWYEAARAAGAQLQYDALAHNLSGYVELLRLFHDPMPTSDLGHWHPLFMQGDEEHDLQDRYYVASVLRALGGSLSQMGDLMHQLGDAVLPSGLLSLTPVYQGSVETTDLVERIRSELGIDSGDRAAISGLTAARDQVLGRADPLEAAAWADAMHLAGGPADPAIDAIASNGLSGVLPQSVTAVNVRQWCDVSGLMSRLGQPVPDPGLSGWPIRDRVSLYQASRLVTCLHDAGSSLAVPWQPTAFLAGLKEHGLVPSSVEFLRTSEAYLLLGGLPSPSLVDLIRAHERGIQGCTELGHLVRVTAGSDLCDLQATLEEVRLNRLLGIRPLAASPIHHGEGALRTWS